MVRIRAITAIILMLSWIAPWSVCAETGKYAAEIEGRHVVKDKEDLKTGRHTFCLTAEGKAPMPEGSIGNVKKVRIGSNEKFRFGRIGYDRPGTYEYVVSRQIVKSDRLKQDDSVYECRVTVMEDGTAVVVFKKKGVMGKPNEILYVDSYAEAPAGSLTGTGDSFGLTEYVAILIASALLSVLMLAVKKRRRAGE